MITLLALTAMLLPVLGATPAGALGTSTINGFVNGPLAGPVGGITVDVFSSYYGSIVATTTTTGASITNFSVGGLPSGTFRLRFTDPNHAYATSWNGGASSFAAAPDITTSPNATTTMPALTLVRAGAITGAATDATGHPLPNLIAVAATAASPTIVGTMTTGADGIVSLPGLAPGGYKVLVVDPNWFASPTTGYRPSMNGDKILGDLTASFNAAPTITVTSNSTSSAGAIHLVPSHCDPATVGPDANLSGQNLSGADLSGCLLTGATLTNANVNSANLSGANLFAANFTSANIIGANVTGTVLANATWSNTMCPNGSITPAVGGTCGAGAPLTFVADVVTDAVDALPGDGRCATAAGGCTIRAATQEANALPTADTIVLASKRSYVFTLVGFGADTPAVRDLDLTNDVTIVGNGATVQQTAPDRVLQVTAGVNAHLANVTITGGQASNGLPGANVSGSGVVPFAGQRGQDGGGINNAGTLTLDSVTVVANQAGNGGAPGVNTSGAIAPGGNGGTGGRGGGISNTGTLTITNSTIVHNVAGSGTAGGNSSNSTGGEGGDGGAGGGIYNTGNATLDRTTVAANAAGNGGDGGHDGALTTAVAGSGGDGGGIFSTTILTALHTTIAEDRAGLAGAGATGPHDGSGGGLYNGGSATIAFSTIAGNVLVTHLPVGARGGGIFSTGSLTLGLDTISDNTAAGAGGAIALSGGNASIGFVTITNNTSGNAAGDASAVRVVAGTVTFTGSIVAAQANSPDCVGAVGSSGYNLESATSCAFSKPGDRQNTDPLLGAIGDNGGPTMTHLPAAASPAVNAVPVGALNCGSINSPTDQRGFPSPVGGACDIGAVER